MTPTIKRRPEAPTNKLLDGVIEPKEHDTMIKASCLCGSVC
jgi:hypothetical protein